MQIILVDAVVFIRFLIMFWIQLLLLLNVEKRGKLQQRKNQVLWKRWLRKLKSDCNIWPNAHNILMLCISTLSHSMFNTSCHSCCISQDIAAGWPIICCMLSATQLQCVVLQYGMVLDSSLHRHLEIFAACEKLPS